MIRIFYLVLFYLFINEKKNNLAWYQRTYFKLVSNLKFLAQVFNFRFFLFIIIIFFFLKLFIFDQHVIYCSNTYLKTHFIGGHIVHFCGDINYSTAFDIIKYIKYNKPNQLIYNIYTPTKLCINTFPYKHPYRHPHLNILQYNNLFSDILVNVQMSSNNFNNCHLLSNKNIFGFDIGQYIANNFYFYPQNEIEKYLCNINDINNNIYINNNKGEIDKYIVNLNNKYKL